MFMKQIFSLKELRYGSIVNPTKVPFTYFPGAKNCLTDLRILDCDSGVDSEFFYQISDKL